MMNNDGALWVRANWDRLAGWAALAGGGLLLLVGTVRIMRARYLVDQLSILMSGGLAGLACVAFGTGLLVMASHQEEWRRLDRLEELVRGAAAVDRDVIGTGADIRPEREPVTDQDVPVEFASRAATTLRRAR